MSKADAAAAVNSVQKIRTLLNNLDCIQMSIADICAHSLLTATEAEEIKRSLRAETDKWLKVIYKIEDSAAYKEYARKMKE